MIPSFIHTGVALYKGLAGIFGISFSGIVFYGTTKIGGPSTDWAGSVDVVGTWIGACGALYPVSLKADIVGMDVDDDFDFSSFFGIIPANLSRSPFIVLIMISSSGGFGVGSAI
ncbi:MAG: hypothetical protein NTV77_02065 [Candidatus Azambacteria bacterium]|nr:hypothetical protein [Candidatus Azambacteria bacterium]